MVEIINVVKKSDNRTVSVKSVMFTIVLLLLMLYHFWIGLLGILKYIETTGCTMYGENRCNLWMYDAGLPATGTAAGISTPTMNATQRVETAADANLSSTQSASARLQNVVASDKNVQQQKKKSAKTVQRVPSSDNIKGRRQTNEIPSDSCVTRPDRDVPTTVSKQRNDVNIDFRTSSQPPRQRLPATDFPQPTDEFGGRMSEPSSLHREQQSSSHVRAEDFLQVSNLLVCHKQTFCCYLSSTRCA